MARAVAAKARVRQPIKAKAHRLTARSKGETNPQSAHSYFSDVTPVEAFFDATAFMQYRNPLGAGPSGKTWPRCASQVLQIVSTRCRKEGPSKRYAIALTFTGWVNDGHPVPDSNFSEASKRTVSQQRQA